MKKQNKARLDFIRMLQEKHPDQYLRTIEVNTSKDTVFVGLFKCMGCNKPITDEQFNFGRTCASCDIGGDENEWIIEKPDSYKDTGNMPSYEKAMEEAYWPTSEETLEKNQSAEELFGDEE